MKAGRIILLNILLSVSAMAAPAEDAVPSIAGQPIGDAELAFFSGLYPDRHLRAIARDRALQQLATEEGLLAQPMDFPQRVRAFHQENARRREMKASGEVFYGPIQYRMDVWFAIREEQLVRALEKQARADHGEAGARSEVAARLVKRTGELLAAATGSP